MLQRGGGYGGDRCDLAPTLCKYDLRRSDLFVLSWARVRRVTWESISSELLMCGGGALLWLDVWRQYIYVYGACLFLCLL